MLGVLPKVAADPTAASKRQWQREAKAQMLRERNRSSEKGMRLRAIPRIDSDRRCLSASRNGGHRAPPNTAIMLFRRPTRQEPKLDGSTAHSGPTRSRCGGSVSDLSTLRASKCRARWPAISWRIACSQRCPTQCAGQQCPSGVMYSAPAMKNVSCPKHEHDASPVSDD